MGEPATKAHAKSEGCVVDPCYSSLCVRPHVSNEDSGHGYWIYGDGELESYRLAILRQRAKSANLKIYYPGSYHEPSREGWFRNKGFAANFDNELKFRSNGSVQVMIVGVDGSTELVYQGDRYSCEHRVQLKRQSSIDFIQIEVETSHDYGVEGPPCISVRESEESSTCWEWSLNRGHTWVACQRFHSGTGTSYPHLYEEPEIVMKPNVVKNDGVHDFGVEVLGRVVIQVSSRSGANNVPRLCVGESMAEVLDESPDNQEQSTELIALETGNADQYSYISAHLLAFRFVRVIGATVWCRASFHPVQYKGAFSCSDDLITQIWMRAAYTLRICMHDFILDGIKRDRLPWAGDLAVSLMANAYAFSEADIVARSLTVLGRAGIGVADINGIVDYSLWWVICHHLYQLYFSDPAHLHREYARIEAALDCLMNRCDNETGYLETLDKEWVFIDWVDMEKATALQVLWWWALRCGSLLAKRVGKANGGKWDDFRVKVERQLESSCCDKDTGLWFAVPGGQHSRHVTILAIASGLHQPRNPNLVAKELIANDLEAVGTPYMKVFECIALSQLNARQAGLQMMKEYWGGMLQKGGSTFWEAYDPSESHQESMAFYGRSFGRSLCHAWSSGPCFYIPTTILGIRPTKDGWKEWECNPRLPTDMTCLYSTIPTPYGEIEVELTHDSFTISIPEGTVMQMGSDHHNGAKTVSLSLSQEESTRFEEETANTIENETLKKWSSAFREWFHYPHHVIPSNPKIAGFGDIHMTDVPTVYQLPGDENMYFMSFVGFDGKGYQSFVVTSQDLVNWAKPQLAMGYGNDGEFDYGGRVLGAYLYESYGVRAPRVLRKKDGKFWSLYGAYSKRGSYEIDPGYEGVAWSSDGVEWFRASEKHILSVCDKDTEEWEKSSIYQPWLLENGGIYYNFYNAKQSDHSREWCEQIGFATSKDLISWKRFDNNPVLRVRQGGFDEQFCADGKIFRDGDHWVMFYFGVRAWTSSIMIAYSHDLIHWMADPEPLYRAGEHPLGLDNEHAHKISLVWNKRNETYYMFYCAVGKEGRGIGLITSSPLEDFAAVDTSWKNRSLESIDSASPVQKKQKPNKSPRRHPHVLLIMADDLGFSDVGCFGSEIETPNIDCLGYSGVRFTQMYNCARCCPSRASLLTGLYPHQAGIGHMVHDSGIQSKAYQGYLRSDCATIAEILRDLGGYTTLMTGKWHVGSEYQPNDPQHWKKHAGDKTHPTPYQRGFDEHYGTLGGGGSYYDPPSLIHNEEVITTTPDDYYYTDKINDEACRMIRKAVNMNGGQNDGRDKPFFLYVAHVAPHWPLHAPPDVIAKYRGKYKDGWDKLRESRHAKLRELGIVKDEWKCSPRDENSFPWEDAQHKDWEDARMATYAAQIDIMDQGIGRIVDTLKDCGVYDDTMVIFLSDNGGCAEFLKEDGGEGSWTEDYATISSDGTQTVVGNNSNMLPGSRNTFMSYGLPWANASNAPFRLFKSWVHEGGISTPCLVHWPNGMAGQKPGRICHTPWIMMDIVATIYHVARVHYPKEHQGTKIPALEGESFLRVLRGNIGASRHRQIFWEHQGNCAVRHGKWKLVKRHGDAWELFDMNRDRTEIHNKADSEEEIVESMIGMWEAWAQRCEVHSWPLHPIPDGEKDWVHFPWLW